MKSFNPYKYTSTQTESTDSHDVTDKIVEKGHKNLFQVDLKKFEEICKNFANRPEKADLKIKKLTGDDKINFELVIKYVHLLYGTQYYSNLHEIVKRIFKNTGATTLKPGTVAAYFAGCLSTKDGCSLGCAGSMPLPKEEEGWTLCDKAVIMAEKGANGYTFSFVKPAEKDEDFDPAYLFVESGEEFNGFNESEKAYLKSLGCKKVKMVSYSDDMNYSDINQEPTSVDEIKSRKNTHHRHSKNANSDSKSDSNSEECSTWLIWLLVFLFVLLLIFLFVAYRYYQKRH